MASKVSHYFKDQYVQYLLKTYTAVPAETGNHHQMETSCQQCSMLVAAYEYCHEHRLL